MRRIKWVLPVITLMLIAAARADDQSPHMKLARQELQKAQDELKSVQVELHDRRNAIRKATGRIEVSSDALRQDVQKLQEQREQLELDEAGAAGRRQGLEKAIAELSKRLQSKAGADPVAEELQKVVEVREKALARVHASYKAAVVSMSDIEAAEAALAQSRADLAAARQRAVSSTSADALDNWNRELLTLSIDEQERQAKLEFIKRRLDQFGPVLDMMDTLDSLQMQLARASRRVEELSRWVDEREFDRVRAKESHE